MFRIPCPKCNKTLKFKNPKYIGTTAKCPACQHKFVLELPPEPADEVELQLAEPPARSTPPPESKQPLVGTSARWVPDEQPAASQAPATPAAVPPLQSTPVPEQSLAGPQPQIAPAGAVAGQSFVDPALPQVNVAAVDASVPTVVVPDDPAINSPVSRLKNRKKGGGKSGLIVGALGLLIASGIGAAAYLSGDSAEKESGSKGVVANDEWEAEKKRLEQSAAAAKDSSPTSGKPIDLRYVPEGANIVVHLHPAEIWSTDESRQEFLFALGPFGKWVGDEIRRLTTFEPKDIDQLTIAIGLGPRLSKPDVTTVVRLTQPFTGRYNDLIVSPNHQDFRKGGAKSENGLTWLRVDEATFAVGPEELSEEMVAAMSYAAEPTDDLRAFIAKTDADRHITVMVDRSQLAVHTEELIPVPLQPAVVKLDEWMGKDVDAFVFSTHLGERMFLETLLRNGTGTTNAKLNRHVQSKLAALPTDVLDAVRLMRPNRMGSRKIIARFPAMLNAVAAATESGIGERFVQLTTVLPERAIPNLAVGALLTIDESTRTDFDRERKVTKKPPTKKLPETLAGRLDTVIDVEFTRTPLQEAFAFLGDEIGINFVLNGDGLKLAGYTQNMAQSFKLGKVPAKEGVRKILSQYDKMRLVANEATKTITVTTTDAIEASGEPAYELP